MNDCAVLSNFLNYLDTIKGKSKATISEYQYDLSIFLKFQLQHLNQSAMPIDDMDINEADIAFINKIKLYDIFAYLNYLDKFRGNSARTRARKIASIRSFYKYLVDVVELVKENPCKNLENPKFRKENPIYLELKEAEHLLKTVKEKGSLRDFSILTIFLNCGVRLGEIVSIDLIKIQDDHFTVIGKGNKERIVYMNQATKDSIMAYIHKERTKDAPSPALFLSKRNTRISRRAIQHLVEKYIHLAGLSESYTTHKLRHTAATLMYKYGSVDIRTLQEILGHVSVSTTQIYTHLDNEQIRSAMSKNPLNSK